jgi:NAD(P)-dependent dehydrogenase (short-subunit alcohol dehydrogenase family)
MDHRLHTDLSGKVAIVTGGSSGLGFVTARELARAGARVYLACRSRPRAELARERILHATGEQVELLDLDLADFASINACARAFLAVDEPLHLLVNNAGLAGSGGLTQAGFELTFGVCHVGHFLLTTLLLPRLQEAAPSRIVTVASRAHRRIPQLDLAAIHRPTQGFGVAAYQGAKLANVLFSAELARKLAGTGVTTYAVHPGVVLTDFWRAVPGVLRPLLRLRKTVSVDEGAGTILRCATAPELAAETGQYYEGGVRVETSAAAQDEGLADALWRQSEQWTWPALPATNTGHLQAP